MKKLSQSCKELIWILVVLLIILSCAHFISRIFDLWWGVNESKQTDMISNIWSFITGTATALLAMIAWKKFGTFHDDSQSRFLLQIDTRWGSQEIIKARTIIHHIYRDIADKDKGGALCTIYPDLGREIVRLSTSEDKLSRDNFMYLLNLLDFMDTIGYLASRNRVNVEELNALCGSSLDFFYNVFEQYIKHKRCKHNRPKLYEHFENLHYKLDKNYLVATH